MTEDKARKRSIRTRMTKTGESYTAARRNVIKPAAPKGVDLGKSDETIKSGSGKTWDEWFSILDTWGAKERTHTEIARYVNVEHDIPGWWAQTVAVGYERGRGMRAVNQRADGAFYVNVSKTIPVGVKRLFEEFTDARKRNRWLDFGTLRTRTSQPPRAARFDFRDGESRIQVWFESKDRAKTTVTVQHERLRGKEEVEEMRAFWKDHLAHLSKRLKT